MIQIVIWALFHFIASKKGRRKEKCFQTKSKMSIKLGCFGLGWCKWWAHNNNLIMNKLENVWALSSTLTQSLSSLSYCFSNYHKNYWFKEQKTKSQKFYWYQGNDIQYCKSYYNSKFCSILLWNIDCNSIVYVLVCGKIYIFLDWLCF